MKVRMTTQIGGYNGGQPWPAVGDVVDVTDTEAADMVASGYATYLGKEVSDANPAPNDTDEPAVDDDSGPVPDDVKPTRKRAARKP